MGPVPALSVVVVAYDMKLQLLRTLRSLSPTLQRGVGTDDYEIIVVDNGSPEPVDRSLASQFGANIRWLEVASPTPSPVPAMNLGLRTARAPLVGAMIDGARMASPGLLSSALRASRVADRPIVATLAHHLGSERQPLAVGKGYDEAVERALLDGVNWTEDPYRLFEVSVFADSSSGGWFVPPAESNALNWTVMMKALSRREVDWQTSTPSRAPARSPAPSWSSFSASQLSIKSTVE